MPTSTRRGFKAQSQVKREGLLAGVFDITCCRDITLPDCDVSVYWVEFKGYDKNGRAGKLS